MAEEVVSGAFPSASLQVLFERMGSQKVVGFVRGKKFHGIFNKLRMVLYSVSGVLDDAETKQLTNRDVRKWLCELKVAIRDVEDLVDEINTKALLCELELQSLPRLEQVSKFVVSSPIELERRHQSDDDELKLRIENIFNWIRFIARRKNVLSLVKGVITVPLRRLSETSTSSSSSSSSFVVEESYIFGRDADRQVIIDLLLLSDDDDDEEEDEGGHKICVIPIVGVGGIGKTTLARLVYMDIDNRVNKPFDIKAWITVSGAFDILTLARGIYETVTNSPNSSIGETFDQLQLELKVALEGKKFLFVLDDVWNEDHENWYLLKTLFESASNGSKIMVTTRSPIVGTMMGTVPNYYLGSLPEEDCWRLFSKHAFANVDPSAYQDLEVIGKEIVKKCNGLPLAIKSIAGLLRAEPNPDKWFEVLVSELWELPGKECKILPALCLSYYFLPPHLKPCFTCCSIFPKGYEFKKKKLILLWMAGDLLLHKDDKMLKDIGEEYFDDLVSRSFFQKNNFFGFTMHDLVHDLAQFVSGEYRLRLDDNYSSIHPMNTHSHDHYHGLSISLTHNIKKLEDGNNLLRTLLPVDGRPWFSRKFLIHPENLKKISNLRKSRLLMLPFYGAATKSFDLLPFYGAATKSFDSIGTLRYLRSLNLSCTRIKQIPYAIGNLMDLRYLDLSNTQVAAIPETVCNLHSLHTLSLKSCRKLNRLPINIERLFNLRHLDIRCTSLKDMPPQISNLRYLKIISDFVVGKNSISDIEVLGEFQEMCDNLSIRSLEKVANIDDVSEANLKDKKCITDLSLEWEGDTNDSQKEREVISRLQQLTDLQQLSLINYGGISFSDWIGEHSFSCLVCMWLSKCKKCHNLPPLGQLPSLKSLIVDRFDMVERIGDEFYIIGSSPVAKPFKSLEKLSFKCMPRWKEWSFVEGDVFSQLKELHLMDCPSLMLNAACFPDSLPSLKYLCISKCQLQVMASLLSCQLPLLSSLYIGYCPELESFPERRLPTNIHTIEICGCENLKSFLEEGWPSSLKSLSIGSCGKLFAPCMQWNLQTLTSLKSLDFSCIDAVVDSFPDGGQLPPSLTSLTLCRLHNLKSLNGKAFQQLTSLEELSISYCQQLQCMPEEGLPATLSSLHLSCLDNLNSLSGKVFEQVASLEKLSISYCPELLCIPEEGLPASLSQLTIECCRFLNPRCQREIGEDWPMIAHIPSIYIIQY